MKQPELGEVFEGRYELVSLLGEGGYARVFRARDLSVGRDVAIKVLSPQSGGYAGVVAPRFMRECKLIAELQDPHTITMYDFGQSASGLLYMVSEYVAGEDLHAALIQRRRLEAAVVLHVLQQLLSALREAHGKGILHRDIKPPNILVYQRPGDPFAVKLLDFGLAKPASVDATQITGDRVVVGTPRYMSPEQILGGALDRRTDIYSLGLVAFEMLTGERAIKGDSLQEFAAEHVMGPPLVVPEHLAPPALRRVITRMAAKRADDRYSNAEDVLRDVARAR